MRQSALKSSARARVSDEAVENATGKTWEAWFRVLDRRKADKLKHKDIVDLLSSTLEVESGWWCQSIANEYEKKKGLRRTGEMTTGGFQIGVQKVIPLSFTRAWRLVTSPEGLRIWLGGVDRLRLKVGDTFECRDGSSGEVRSVDRGTKLRIRHKRSPSASPTVIQVYLQPAAGAGRTAILFHQEKLASSAERERMRRHWAGVLARLEKAAAELSKA